MRFLLLLVAFLMPSGGLHRTIPPAPPAEWHLAEMQDQGEYFLLLPKVYESEALCEAEAYQRDLQRLMWRYICLGEPK